MLYIYNIYMYIYTYTAYIIYMYIYVTYIYVGFSLETKLFILSTLFDKDYSRISYHICSRNIEHCYSLPIISIEKVILNYSAKNIPTPSERSYLLKLTEKIELVIKRM